MKAIAVHVLPRSLKWSLARLQQRMWTTILSVPFVPCIRFSRLPVPLAVRPTGQLVHSKGCRVSLKLGIQ